ncbi:MAG: alpha/beta hydrolase, partial [Proteobacteria bacterium]|nr:alpha/beta hydrolase [Pseudomonadota bacterium]
MMVYLWLILAALALPQSTVLVSDGFEIEHVEAGRGRDVVLIHGFGDSIETWGRCWNLLAEEANVHAYNTLGVGRSNSPRFFHDPLLPPKGQPENPYPLYDLDTYVEQLLALLEAKKIKKAVLVGHSLGAQVALTVAALHPERVAGLVLIDPSGGSKMAPIVPQAYADIIGQVNGDDNKHTEALVRRILTDLLPDTQPLPDSLVHRFLAPWESAEGRRTIRNPIMQFRLQNPQVLYRAMTAGRVASGAKAPKHRVLVIWGEEDAWFPVEGMDEYLRHLPGASTLGVPQAGHLPHWEKPVTVCPALASFVGSKSGVLAPPSWTREDLVQCAKNTDEQANASHCLRALGFLAAGDTEVEDLILELATDAKIGAAAQLSLKDVSEARLVAIV